MKKIFTLLCLFIFQLTAFSQNEARNWYFGTNAGLDFSTSPPTILTNGMLVTNEGCASISDPAGNLLFYTDGSNIYDKTHALMTNGTGLTGNPSTTQSGIIVKQPGSSTIYYVFTLGASGTGSLCFSVVDLTLAGGLGAVTVKNTLLGTNMSEKLTSVYHCNGRDIWVLAHENNSNNFRAYLVTSTGVNTTPVVTPIGISYSSANGHWLGNMKISPNGRKIGIANHGSSKQAGFQTFDFDNATGIVSNLLLLDTTLASAYGCEFSPDGSKFYGDCESGGSSLKLFQWDLCAGSPTAIVASEYSVAVPSQIMGMQLGTDGKIYLARSGQTVIAVINNPNASGAACNYNHTGQSIAPKKSNLNLPNFMTGYFKPTPTPFTYTASCSNVSFSSPAISNTANAGCGAVVTTPTNVLWSFGEPLTATNTSTLTNPSHNYTGAGTYTVQLVLYGACSSDTLRQTVTITNASPTMAVSGAFTMCAGEKRTFTVSGASSYTWHTGVHTPTIVLNPTLTTSYSVSGTGTNSCQSSKLFTVTVNKCTGIAVNGDEDQHFSIYPNPASGYLFVETTTTLKVQILSQTGLVVMERAFENGKEELDISRLSDGIYTVRCTSGKSTVTKRLVKIE